MNNPATLYTLGDRTDTISAWAASLGMTVDGLYSRFYREWPLEKALTTPSLRRLRQRENYHMRTEDGRFTPEYACWSQWKCRCSCDTHPNWGMYGGKGIRMCSAWAHSFTTFLADVGYRPTEGRWVLACRPGVKEVGPGALEWITVAESNRRKREARK